LKYENQIATIEKQKETRAMLKGSTKVHPTSLMQRLRANSKYEHGHNWKKNQLFCISHQALVQNVSLT